ncbi:uncharacterized protein LOC143920689 isoform X2 [Arctopsyche grandis]|uniref:uncharacterized protein LOC143920689 isoform X2 n=1 Tax=Arctopsyche grandis TaxID=121162 RepID=UPI00406D9900
MEIFCCCFRSENEYLYNEFPVGAEREDHRIPQPDRISQPSTQWRNSLTDSAWSSSSQDDNYEGYDTGGQNNKRLQGDRTSSHNETIENGVVISNILHDTNNSMTWYDMADNLIDFRDTPQTSNGLPTTNALTSNTNIWTTGNNIEPSKRDEQNDLIHKLKTLGKWNQTGESTSTSVNSRTPVPEDKSRPQKKACKNSIPQESKPQSNQINEFVDVEVRKASIRYKEPEVLAGSLFSNILSGEDFDEYLDGVYLAKCENEMNEFKMIEKEFMKTTQKHFKVLAMEKIFNPYMRASYLLRKKEYELLYGSVNVKEKLMFHGTSFHNVIDIVTWNFNWRLTGKSKGHIFGQGISFTPISNYASNYSDKKTEKKYMLVVSMLECFRCEGSNNMLIPPVCERARVMGARYDTSGKPDGHVLVKYRDDEFYPSYMITYTGTTIRSNINRA